MGATWTTFVDGMVHGGGYTDHLINGMASGEGYTDHLESVRIVRLNGQLCMYVQTWRPLFRSAVSPTTSDVTLYQCTVPC